MILRRWIGYIKSEKGVRVNLRLDGCEKGVRVNLRLDGCGWKITLTPF